MDDVLVVIPCYDQAKYLAEAIESALAQTYPVDVVVVDDGSRDGAAEVARCYPVRLIRQQNRGVSAARNAGIASGTHAWVLPLDADDRLEPAMVETLIGLDDIAGPSVLTFGSTEAPWGPPLAHPVLADFLEANHCIMSSLYRRQVWAAIGGYDEAMRDGGEDWDFWIRAAAAGFAFTIVSDRLFRYRVYRESRADRPNSSGRFQSKRAEIRAYMAAKYAQGGL